MKTPLLLLAAILVHGASAMAQRSAALTVPPSPPVSPTQAISNPARVSPTSAKDVLGRRPGSGDGLPAYQQDMHWLDPTGRSWVMRDLGHGGSVWIAEDPAARVLDQIGGAKPAAAYGMLRLTSAYTGPAVLVVNAATKATLTVGFLPDGTLDEAALSGFCISVECRVAKWFDQSGHGRDAGQIETSAQPLIRMSHRTGKPLSVVWDFEATSGSSVRALTLPSSLMIDSGNMTVLWTGRFHNAAEVSPLIELGVDANAFNFGYWDVHGDFYLGTPNHLSELQGHAALTPAVGLIASTQTEGTVTNYRNQLETLGKMPPEIHRGGLIGQTFTYKQSGMMELSSQINYDRGLGPLERMNGLHALGENFGIPQQQQDVYVADGDSLTQGISSQYLQSYPWYMERLLPRSAVLYNAGWAAKTLGGADGLVARYDVFTSKLFNPNARSNVISLFGGTNDLQGGSDDRQIFRLVQQYAAAARKTGFKIIVTTMIPRASFNPKMEGFRIAFNTTIRAHWKEFADCLVDLAADPAFSDTRAVTDTTLYAEDGIHLSEIGYQIVATDLASAVAPFFE